MTPALQIRVKPSTETLGGVDIFAWLKIGDKVRTPVLTYKDEPEPADGKAESLWTLSPEAAQKLANDLAKAGYPPQTPGAIGQGKSVEHHVQQPRQVPVTTDLDGVITRLKEHNADLRMVLDNVFALWRSKSS